MLRFKIKEKDIGTDKLFFVIEEGQANLGNFDQALSFVDVASKVGADAIEFQLAKAKDFYVAQDPGFQTYLNREFDNQQLKEIVAYTKKKSMEFIAVPLSHKLVNILAKAGCSGFNINASDLTNPDVIDSVIDSGLPFFLSLPLATEEEIEWAIHRISKKKALNFALMHGQHTMASGESGVNAEHTFLGCITKLKQKYQVPIGFVDHTPLKWVPAAAVAAGADIVSKHLALSRMDKGPDWQVCLEPEEMKEAIRDARKIKESMNVVTRRLAPGETLDRTKMRRSIVAANRIKAGTILKRTDFLFKRPGDGICPSKFQKLIGKKVLREIKPDEQIKLEDIQEA